uniref:MBL fold metallo-hydrolase n=1 Tax=candidate division WOR-3 bacterium TaxID=2052148 RepID=A0A7C4U900_UNCW3
MRFIVVFSDKAKDRKLLKGWGVSIYFPDFYLLFDTGENPLYLQNNLKVLGISLNDIKYVFLTHEHWDHIGGIELLKGEKRIVFVPEGFTEDTIEELNALRFDVRVIDKNQKILPDVYSTGPLGDVVKEQSIIFSEKEGLNIFTGCAHPGFKDIFETASRYGTLFKFVSGGFHLLDADEGMIKDVQEIFNSYRVRKVGPFHCTGDEAMERFKEQFGDDFILVKSGEMIKI